MNREMEDIGRQLGEDGVASIVSKVEQYCIHEEKRITLENHAHIVILKAECSLLLEEEHRLRELLRNAPPPGDLLRHRRKRIFAGVVAAVLTVTGFFLAVLTFAPFRLGWQGYLFCCGVATVVPFLVEKLLDGWRNPWVGKTLTTVAAVAGIASLMLLADVRGHFLAHQVEDVPALVVDDTQPQKQTPKGDFYHATLDTLRLATVLLSLAMELGAGLALREACAEPPHDLGHWTQLRSELAMVQTKLVLRAGQITRLEDEPSILTAGFWRDFYKSMLTHTVRSTIGKLLVFTVTAALFVPWVRAATTSHLDMVIAIDLSRSTAEKGPDGKTDLEKNVDGVTAVFAEVPAGTHVTVFGITDHTFTQPYILLSASVPDDPGYFGERLSAERLQLVRAWKQKSSVLQPISPGTDIVGALRLASYMFQQEPLAGLRRILVLFSDMRNQTSELDLYTQRGVAAAYRDGGSARRNLPDLSGVRIYALGVGCSRRHNRRLVQTGAVLEKIYVAASKAQSASFSTLRTIATRSTPPVMQPILR